MNIREQIEEREALLLSPYAAKRRDAIRDIEESLIRLEPRFNAIGIASFIVNVLDG